MTLFRLELLSTDEVDHVLTACRELLALPEGQRRTNDKPHAGTHHLVELDERIALVGELLQRPALLELVAEIIGEQHTTLQVSYRSPQPGFGAQKLHTDGLAKMHDGPDTLATAIVALVDFTALNGATRLVPGSHLRPDLQRQAGNLDNHRDQVSLTGTAGTAFVFSGHVLHSGTKNESDTERPALQIQWQRLESQRVD